jgi:hypothetical protein
MSNSKEKKKQKTDAVIVVAIIGLVGTIMTAAFNSSVIIAWLQKSPESTIVPTNSQSENFLPPSASLFFGPENGQLQHEANGGIVDFPAEVSLENFAAEATFINPYSATDHPWIMLLLFRNGFRVWAKSDNEWGAGFMVNSIWTDSNSGQLQDNMLFKNNNESNQLKFIASGDLGCLYVNNNFVSQFNLSGLVQPGNIKVGVGEQEYTMSGATTEFRDFAIYTISSISECPK